MARSNDVSEAKHFLSHLLFQFSFESKNEKLAITDLGNSEIILFLSRQIRVDFYFTVLCYLHSETLPKGSHIKNTSV